MVQTIWNLNKMAATLFKHHSKTKHYLSTIRKLNKFGIQAPTVPLYLLVEPEDLNRRHRQLFSQLTMLLFAIKPKIVYCNNVLYTSCIDYISNYRFFDSANSSFIHDSIWMPVMQILPVNLELVFNPKIELFFISKVKQVLNLASTNLRSNLIC